MHPMLNVAILAVRKSSSILHNFYEKIDLIKYKNRNFFSVVLSELEYNITKVIQKFYPNHLIIRQKINQSIYVSNKKVQWIINPLNGKTNFIKKFPHFSTSISVLVKGKTEICVVYDLMKRELFTAVRGQGAQLNGYRLYKQNSLNLKKIILAIKNPLLYNNKKLDKLVNYYHIDIRSTGSTVLDMAYVASGRIDGFLGSNVKPITFLSGELLIKESGRLITDFSGEYKKQNFGNVVIGNTHIINLILSIFFPSEKIKLK